MCNRRAGASSKTVQTKRLRPDLRGTVFALKKLRPLCRRTFSTLRKLSYVNLQSVHVSTTSNVLRTRLDQRFTEVCAVKIRIFYFNKFNYVKKNNNNNSVRVKLSESYI